MQSLAVIASKFAIESLYVANVRILVLVLFSRLVIRYLKLCCGLVGNELVDCCLVI